MVCRETRDKFRKCYEDNGRPWDQLKFYATSRWTSAGGTIKRLVKLSRQRDPMFLPRLAYLADVLHFINEANGNLQGMEITISEPKTEVLILKQKLRQLKITIGREDFIGLENFEKITSDKPMRRNVKSRLKLDIDGHLKNILLCPPLCPRDKRKLTSTELWFSKVEIA